ncbi:MAG: hypothetical protein IPI67_00490 [Myxococcales bacterium]|nr:hypothetical protein [Myxococcales bacterium]
MLDDEKLLENVRLAAGCGAGPTMLLTVALASSGAVSIDEALDRLNRLRGHIAKLEKETQRPHAVLAELEPELLEQPPVARMRLDIGDHELRGRLVFGELLGRKSFMQAAALAVAGVGISESDGKLLDDIGVLAQLADPRIWPLTVARRISANGGSLAEAVTAGVASLCTEQMTGMPSAGMMRFLERVEQAVARGESLESAIRGALSRGERIPGVGRPVLRGDERIAPMLETMARHGRGDGPSVTLAKSIDQVLATQKGLRVNSAGFCGALMRDLGFLPDAAAAFCLIYFLVPVLTHATGPRASG